MVTQCPSCRATFEVPEDGGSTSADSEIGRCPECGCSIDHSVEATASMETTDSVPSQFVTQLPPPDTTILRPPSEMQREQLAHFELVRLLGQGGYGTVWLARDTNLNRNVALKLPKDPDAELLHEAQTAARLKHPNIVSVFEVGVEKSHLYIASEFIDGESLKDELQRGRPTVDRAVGLVRKIAGGAHHAHDNDIVHRDLKPANVIIDKSGEPFITDFGIAKSVDADETISLDGQIVGTIAYMAPEQAMGHNTTTDRRADVYALGVMLFELLTEYRPFRGTAQGILFQKNNEDAPSPRTLVPTLPRDLETICLKCLSRAPERRYRTALELAEELERFERNLPILARPISRTEKVWRWACRNPGISSLSASLLLSLLVGLIGVTYFWQNALASNLRTEQTLYRAHLNLAAAAWWSADVDAVRSFLNRYHDPRFQNLQDFSFRHLRHSISPVVQTVQHGSPVKALAMSFDGRLLATVGHRDHALRVWDAANGELIFDRQNLDYQPVSVAFSPLDLRLASGDDDGMVRVWNPLEHDRLAFQLNHGAPISVVCFSPDRRFIASADNQGTLRIWKVSTRNIVAEISQSDQPITSVRFSPDSSTVAAVFRNSLGLSGRETGTVVTLQSADGQEILRCKPVRQLRSLYFTASGRELVAAADTGILYAMSCQTGDITVIRPSNHGTPIGGLTRLGDSEDFIIVDGYGRCRRLGPDFRDRFRIFTHHNFFGLIDAARDGTMLAVGSGDGRATVLDTRRLQPDNVGWQPDVVRDVAFIDDHHSVAVACADGAVRIWRSLSGEWEEAIAPDLAGRAALSVSVHDRTIAACGMMRELRLSTGNSDSTSAVCRLPPGGHEVVQWSRDGRLLAVGGRGGILRIYRDGVFDAPAVEIATDKRINGLSFSTDSTRLAVAGRGVPLRLVDTRSGQTVELPFSAKDEPTCLTFSRDNSTLIVATQQGFLHFFTGPELQTVVRRKAHAGSINGIAAFPNADQIVTAGQDRRLTIFDVPTQEIVMQLSGHERAVLSVAVSSDGSTLASCSIEGDVRIWRTSDP